uniref:peptidylprolyl isomerase n=1 Tax=Neogobius melanostomus TaxID=47308 RepID=A0A8C6TRQ6_9GOBI
METEAGLTFESVGVSEGACDLPFKVPEPACSEECDEPNEGSPQQQSECALGQGTKGCSERGCSTRERWRGQRRLRKTNSFKMVRFQEPSQEESVSERDSSTETLSHSTSWTSGPPAALRNSLGLRSGRTLPLGTKTTPLCFLIEDRLLRKKILEPGCAPRPCWGEQVTVRMQAVVEDRTVVEKDSKLVFVIGEGDVSQALEEGVLSMQKGEVSLLLADSQYTYGHLGREPDIPSWAPLLYQLQLWDVQRKADPQSLPIAERIRIGNHKRERGNFYFQREEYNRAAQAYCMGLEISTEEKNNTFRSKLVLLKCLNNLAMVQLKLEQQEQALKTCREALQLDPQNVKALFRCGKLLSDKGEYKEGMELLKKALKLEPTTKVRKYSIFYKGHAHCSRSTLYPKMTHYTVSLIPTMVTCKHKT